MGFWVQSLAVFTLSAVNLQIDPPAVRLEGPDARAQLVVTGLDHDGRAIDLTREHAVHYQSLDGQVATVDASGEVRASGEGATEIRIHRENGESSHVQVSVSAIEGRRRVRFAGEIVPILTKLGCNGGACHGKSTGQNGFRLSLRGADPTLDFESLTRDARGRRVFLAAPGESLILKKPTARVPHGGGKQLDVGSAEYRTLARWIGQGTPIGVEPALVGLEVKPVARVVLPKGSQQLRAVAKYDDGSAEDVTALADYHSNEPDLADVNGHGFLQTRDGIGEAAIVVRFGGLVASSRITVPRRGKVAEWVAMEGPSRVDRFVDAELKALNLPPSPPALDGAFARRSALDLCGVLPTRNEVEALETSTDPEKRAKWIDGLLDRPEYADRFALKWSAILRNQRTLGPPSQPGTFAFHAWVRAAIAENRPFESFVTALLTAQGDAGENPPVVWFRQSDTAEGQADDVAQLFLGLRLQCARCHRHPYENWGPDDYYGFAAFFSRIGRKQGPDPVTPRVFVLPEGRATDPLTGREYSPRFPRSGLPLNLGPDRDPRAALADWLRRPDNPYFARAIVNRYWKHFFGRGLVEPEDDFRASNPPSIPSLLDALADDFARHGFDVKRLVRTLATSRAYGRSSLPNEENARDRSGFSRFTPRRLPAELLLDAINTVCGTTEVFEGLPSGTRAAQLPDDGFDTPGRFLATFGRPKRATVCECERVEEPSLSQSLHLLNSSEVEHKVADPFGRASRWSAEARPDSNRVEELYRVACSRAPTRDETASCLDHLARRRQEKCLQKGYEDLIWAVINTKEFGFVE